ncbi:PilZ domain-containing protein [Aurantiacibacter flavus]|uniref:PilZ domain-containing protein n=1 Tax=Aurantiacibacter flavus TaxID=3145232 RepID=A0ABV0CZ54_9SPHN
MMSIKMQDPCRMKRVGTPMQDPARLDNTSAPSSGQEGSGAEMRTAPRVGLLIRPAKLISPDHQFVCVIRDLSATGLSVCVFHALPSCDQYTIEFQNGDRIPAEVMWQHGDRMGLRFLESADLDRLIQSPSRFAKRPIRVELDCPAILAMPGRDFSVRICDISGQGAKIACDEHLMLASNVVLRATHLPSTRAKIRWRRNGAYGLVFEDTMQMSELARIVAAMQNVAL